MPAEISLDGTDDGAGLRAEYSIFEGLHHRAVVSEEAEVTALAGGSWILRELLGKLGELRRILARIGGDLLCLLLRRGLVLGARIRLDRNQDVRGLPLLGLAVILKIRVVLFFHVRGIDGDLGAERIGGERHVLELHFLGHLECRLIGVVELLHRRIVDLGVLGK